MFIKKKKTVVHCFKNFDQTKKRGFSVLLDDGVRRVRQNATCTAHSHVAGAALAAIALGGVRVDATARLDVAEEADEAVLAPRRCPRVAHDPVRLAGLLPVAHELHGVVDGRAVLVAAVVDTRLVRLPRRRIDADGDGADVGDGVHEAVVVVRLDALVARELHNGVDGLVVGELAGGIRAEVGRVGVRRVRRDTAVLDDGLVGDLRRATLAATRAATLHGVRRARRDLLLGKLRALVEGKEHPRLDGFDGGEGPAAAALALVLDGRDDAGHLAVVERVGDRLARDLVVLHGLVALTQTAGVGHLAAVPAHGLELLVRAVGEVVDAGLPAEALAVDAVHRSEVALEGGLAELVLRSVGVDLVELSDIHVVVVALGLKIVPASGRGG
eukprot:PhM_4_TR11656/c5_g2_i9/m.16431